MTAATWQPTAAELAGYEQWANRLVALGDVMTDEDKDAARVNRRKNISVWLIAQAKKRGKWVME